MTHQLSTALWAQRFFTVPLRNLGEIDPRFEGIASPEPEIGVERIGITEQFLGDAQTYHARYSNSDHWTELFKQAFEETGIKAGESHVILDIGTGSGTNTILPCLKLLPGSTICATDLSPDLLKLLQSYILSQGLNNRVACICTDAMNNFFVPETFDVVVGGAILHHLIDPTLALAATYRTLKPGGIAFFFEPFEGLSLLRLAYEAIIQKAESFGSGLNPDARRLLAAISLDYATRAGSDKSAPHFQHMDDKWLFSRRWLEAASRREGFSEISVVPHATHATLYREYTMNTLRLAASLGPDCLPDWAWDVIGRFDSGMSREAKHDLPLEATIVLRKAATERKAGGAPGGLAGIARLAMMPRLPRVFGAVRGRT